MDILYAVAQYVEKHGRGPRLILMNLSRARQGFTNYPAIESAKDAVFFSGKYESCQVFYDFPHIFVFANWRPDRSQMSEDRWVIFRVSSGELIRERVTAPQLVEPMPMWGGGAGAQPVRRAENTGGSGSASEPFTWVMPRTPTRVNDTMELDE